MNFIIFSLVLFGFYGTVFSESDLKKIIDLSWDYDNETIVWPGIQSFVYTRKITSDKKGYWYAMNEFCVGEHGGTHLDAPYHFNKAGWKVGEIPLDRLMANGVLLDLRNEVKNKGAETQLLVEHLENWQQVNGNFPDKTVLLVQFGWAKYWTNATEYYGRDQNGTMHFPGISGAAADWIVKSGKFFGVGLDTPSVDPGTATDYMAHRILSKAQLYNMENVKITEELPSKGFKLTALPMKLKEGTGAPLRLIATLN